LSETEIAHESEVRRSPCLEQRLASASDAERSARAELAEARAEAERERADRDGLRSRLRALLEAPSGGSAARVEAVEPAPAPDVAEHEPQPEEPANAPRSRKGRRQRPEGEPSDGAVRHGTDG